MSGCGVPIQLGWVDPHSLALFPNAKLSFRAQNRALSVVCALHVLSDLVHDQICHVCSHSPLCMYQVLVWCAHVVRIVSDYAGQLWMLLLDWQQAHS